MQDMTIQNLSSPLVLRIEQGPDAGRAISIDFTGVFVIGRHDDCQIKLPDANKAASRKHAALTVHPDGRLEIEDLGSNNGTFKEQRQIQKDSLKTGDRFSIGDNVLVVDQKGAEQGQTPQKPMDPDATVYIHPPLKSQKKKPNFVRLLTLTLALILCLGLLAVALTGGDKDKQSATKETPQQQTQQAAKTAPEKPAAHEATPAAQQQQAAAPAAAGQAPSSPESTQTAQPSAQSSTAQMDQEPTPGAPAPETPEAPATPPSRQTALPSQPEPETASVPQAQPEQANAPPKTPEAPPATGAAADASNATAEQLFQEGMFFYKAGNLPKAVDAWSQAFARDPEHESARKWLLRAEGELDEAIDKHYRQGLMAQKYMRWDEARHEFTMVIKWSQSDDDERYLDAKQKLREIEEAQQ